MQAFRKVGFITLSVGVLALAPLSTVAATTGMVESEHQRGPLVNATFSSIDGPGCIDTGTFVTANESTD